MWLITYLPRESQCPPPGVATQTGVGKPGSKSQWTVLIINVCPFLCGLSAIVMTSIRLVFSDMIREHMFELMHKLHHSPLPQAVSGLNEMWAPSACMWNHWNAPLCFPACRCTCTLFLPGQQKPCPNPETLHKTNPAAFTSLLALCKFTNTLHSA